ncbi:hypothetical protein JIG36_35550 [Actinoplanes sp. LDG1-06]|uniref:Trypsin-co-occurring domain-containing protein n=1 Tax=Paractinoplanes ovalisporus TaxID=2810368 RepID=A0ABS2ALW1_9ACTN|nr:CU044_2847 family protein [Actinoplanes ovalisporus]MBM2620829.1 hypothetical protein [Actinoplanes ovalisporus]
MTSELMSVRTEDGSAALFEVDVNPGGLRDVSFDGKIVKAKETLEQSLVEVRRVALKALDTFRDGGADGPDQVELEFGVKFKAEAGTAVFAKAAAEGHIVVRLSWKSGVDGPGGPGGGEADDE